MPRKIFRSTIAALALAAALISLTGTAGAAPSETPQGYRMIDGDGNLYAFGSADTGTEYAQYTGAVALAERPQGDGFWVAFPDGYVRGFGSATMHSPSPLVRGVWEDTQDRVVAIMASVTGEGYTLVSQRGNTHSYGDGPSHGTMVSKKLNGSIIAAARTPSGQGYWLVGSDGGIFTFGDAAFHGSTGNMRLNKPVVGIAPSHTGQGYWLVASDGGIFTFGDAVFKGSMGDKRLNRPVIGMVGYGDGYLMVGADGGIFTFGNVAFYGSLGGNPPAAPVLAVTAHYGS